MEDLSSSAGVSRQRFVVTVDWSPEAEVRLTEGDVREALEELAMDLDEDAVVEAVETVDGDATEE